MLLYWLVKISIHAPTRGATKTRNKLTVDGIFQSTLPREERRCNYFSADGSKYFNPRSHERSDEYVCSFTKKLLISIHAPTRGATHPPAHAPCRHQISIHAPTRGATKLISSSYCLMIFQSTLPREERRFPFSFQSYSLKISIHAPTRGATVYNVPHTWIPVFQSTLPREERPACFCCLRSVHDFNPRSHERSDAINKI